MKSLILTLMGIALLWSCSPKRPHVVERPVFEVWNSTTLEIDKIEFTDSSTVFHFDAFFRPNNWIKIVSDTYIRESGSDERLMIIHAEGLELDTEFFMPESGETSFKLYFPGLPKHVTKIDFIESDCEDCFKIWGIHLLPGSEIQMENLAFEASDKQDEELPALSFSDAPATVSGRILGYSEEAFKDEVPWHSLNIFSLQTDQTSMRISPEGHFSGVSYPGMPQIQRLGYMGPLLVIPGEETRVLMDLKRKTRFESRYRPDKDPSDSLYFKVQVKGLGAVEFLPLNNTELVDFDELMKVAAEQNPMGFQTFLKEQIDQRMEEDAVKGYSPKMQQLTKAKLKMEALRYLLMYKSFATHSKLMASGLPRDRWQELEVEVEEPGTEFYSSLTSLYDMNGLYFSDGLAALRYTSSLEHLRLKANNATTEERFLYFKENAPDFFQQNGLVMDLVCVQFFAGEAQRGIVLNDQRKEAMFALLNDSLPGQLLVDENDRMLALVESTKQASGGAFTINEVPQVEDDQVLEAILEQYPGKVVLVDFWATWCGPCIGSIEPMKPVKKNMADKDVVFVYLTDGSSPIGAWSKYLPEIGGQHYRLSNELMQHLRSKLGIEGIPTFIVFDKEGQEIEKHTGFPGAAIIEAAIEKGLN